MCLLSPSEIMYTVWSGKSLQLLCIFPFDILCLTSISMILVKLCWQCVYWWAWWSERKRTVFRELCPVSFLIVGESPSVLL